MTDGGHSLLTMFQGRDHILLLLPLVMHLVALGVQERQTAFSTDCVPTLSPSTTGLHARTPRAAEPSRSPCRTLARRQRGKARSRL